MFGCVFGLSELVNRYPELKYLFKVTQSYFYLLMNGFISVGALFLIKYLKKESTNSMDNIEINNLIIAGFGGMMILRSSIFSIKHKGEKVDIGLGTIAQIFLDSVEKKMSTNAAAIRIEEIETLMTGIDFNKAKDELSSLCVAFIDNFSEEDKSELNKGIQAISNLDIANHNKSMQLGRYISKYCDKKVLQKAVEKLGESIKISNSNSTNVKEESLDDLIKRLRQKK